MKIASGPGSFEDDSQILCTPCLSFSRWGGPVLQAFSYAMLVGVIAGTWSSMFVATGFLAEWYLASPEKKK